MSRFKYDIVTGLPVAIESMQLNGTAPKPKEASNRIIGVTIREPSGRAASKLIAPSNMFMAMRVLMQVNTKFKMPIMRKCGKNLVKTGIICPACSVSMHYHNANESFKEGYQMIEVKDNNAHCLNCNHKYEVVASNDSFVIGSIMAAFIHNRWQAVKVLDKGGLGTHVQDTMGAKWLVPNKDLKVADALILKQAEGWF